MGGLLHLVQQGGTWAGWGPVQSPPRCTKRNSPPIDGQCTSHCIAMMVRCSAGFNVAIRGLNRVRERETNVRKITDHCGLPHTLETIAKCRNVKESGRRDLDS